MGRQIQQAWFAQDQSEPLVSTADFSPDRADRFCLLTDRRRILAAAILGHNEIQAANAASSPPRAWVPAAAHHSEMPIATGYRFLENQEIAS